MFSTVYSTQVFSSALSETKCFVFFSFFFPFFKSPTLKDECRTQSECFRTRLWCWGSLGWDGDALGFWRDVWSRMACVCVCAHVCVDMVGSSFIQIRPKRYRVLSVRSVTMHPFILYMQLCVENPPLCGGKVRENRCRLCLSEFISTIWWTKMNPEFRHLKENEYT